MNDERLLAIISRLEGDIRNLEQAVAKAAEASIKQSQQVVHAFPEGGAHSLNSLLRNSWVMSVGSNEFLRRSETRFNPSRMSSRASFTVVVSPL